MGGAGAALGSGIVVRPATPDDAGAISRLCDALNEHEGEPVGLFTPDLIRKDGFDRAPPEFRVLMAVVDGEPAGYAMFHPSYSSEHGQRGLYLQDLYVADGVRRRGVGRALLAGVARAAADEGRNFVWWCSKPWNEDARAFYAGLGAVEEDIRAHAVFGDAFAALAAGSPAPAVD